MTPQQSIPDADESIDDQSAETDGSDPSRHERVRLRTRPTIKPPLVWILVTVIVGGALALASFANVYGLEDPGLASIVGWTVVFVVFVVSLRLLVRIYVLTRTTYTVTETDIRHEFSLWFRQYSREIPLDRVRGQEFQQDRIQRVFGVGTISVLTGGTNASLGYVEFQNVPNPNEVTETVREQRLAASPIGGLE
ncbi:PH domain-containing protein [Natrarchaeobius halalkaliphilus]|uniref:PH domain-containing protein n=1 Tax=Natrarchaeobius halalkaliphilus TaxID=1679091 RepID=A0A3N6MS62_9EURY|nr:PH domain-containing protein [Natrarchaeobius halalkaliphilus]RQG87063.1 PH domain-containing protein [Natrarchaeobius halalkaliphilus]